MSCSTTDERCPRNGWRDPDQLIDRLLVALKAWKRKFFSSIGRKGKASDRDYFGAPAFPRGLPERGVETGQFRTDKICPKDSDERWEVVGRVGRLFIYPLKSARGKSVYDAKVEKYGLSYKAMFDRQLMIVDKRNFFATARRFPKLVLVKAEKTEDELTLSAPGMKDLVTRLPKADATTRVGTRVFEESCEGLDVGGRASDWISRFLGHGGLSPFRIIYHPYDPVKRAGNKRDHRGRVLSVTPNLKSEDKSLFADHQGFMVMTKKSIDALNDELRDRRVDLKVEHRRFRPNILVEGDVKPFDEDEWLYIRINKTVFRTVRYCTRCVFTTVDPETGLKNKSFEPLKTLKEFRSSLDPRERKIFGSSPFFGLLLGVEEGIGERISVGDKVFVIRNK